MRFSIAAAFLLSFLSEAPLGAQSYSCASVSADMSVGLKNEVVTLVTGTNASIVANRNAYLLLAATANQVTLVTQNNTCKNAGQAYHAAINPPGTPEVSRTMVVIKVSTTRYVITDPSEKQGEYGTVVVTDNNFNVLAKYSL